MTVLIDLTLDGHCLEGQPHLTSHTEHPMSHNSQMFHCFAFFLTEQTTALEYRENHRGVKNNSKPATPFPSSETDHTM